VQESREGSRNDLFRDGHRKGEKKGIGWKDRGLSGLS